METPEELSLILSSSSDLSYQQEMLAQEISHAANRAAQGSILDNYLDGLAPNTKRNQAGAIRLFMKYLEAAQFPYHDFNEYAESLESWGRITWGLVQGFREWLKIRKDTNGHVARGSTIAIRLATIKARCHEAYRAGWITHEEWSRISDVEGFGNLKAQRLDALREYVGQTPEKKEAIFLTGSQMTQLMSPGLATAQNRRDSVMMHFLCHHGLRREELAQIKTTNIDLIEGTFTFYRPKVHMTQKHACSPGLLQVLRPYMERDQPGERLLWGSNNRGELIGVMSGPSMYTRVKTLGRRILQIPNLSPHDLRHSWATLMALQGYTLEQLKNAGGWSSYVMPLYYIKLAETSNKGMLPNY